MLSIKQLIVVAGPSCAGKTYLLDGIRAGRREALCQQLGVANPSSCPQLHACELADSGHHTLDNALLHYDFYTQDLPAGYRYLDELFQHCDGVTILTLCASPESLAERNSRRLRQAVQELALAPLFRRERVHWQIHILRWLLKRRSVYGAPSAVAALYQKWAEFIRTREATCYWLDTEAPAAAVAVTDPIPLGPTFQSGPGADSLAIVNRVLRGEKGRGRRAAS